MAYDGLPISSGSGHTLRVKDRRAIWERMCRFLGTFTTCAEFDDVRLLLAEGSHVDAAFDRAHAFATRRFGASSRRLAVSGALTEYEHAWVLRREQIEDALEALPFRLSPTNWARWQLNAQGTPLLQEAARARPQRFRLT